jgi:hypothetical protein
VYHEDRSTTGFVKQAGQPGTRFSVHREVNPQHPEDTVGLDEIALHVNEQKCCVRGVDQFGELGEDLFAFNGYQCSASPGSSTPGQRAEHSRCACGS